jgi:proteasome accessory factor B
LAKKTEWQPNRSEKSERLLQLASALLFTNRGLTKQELFFGIAAYSEALAQGTDEDSLNRMFERDKSDLRSTGLLIDTPNSGADSDEIRYAIKSEVFEWPNNIELSAHQLQLLNLAAQAWSHASIATDVNHGLMRLRALGVAPAENELIGLAPRIKTHEPSFIPLNRALDENIEVRFEYRRPDGTVSMRHVQPWVMRSIDGQWLLMCWDLGRREVRNFLLKRIVSKVTFLKENETEVVFEAPEATRIEAAIQDLREFTASQIAVLRIKRDSRAWFHYQIDSQEAFAEVELQYMDVHLLAEELRDFGADIKVLRPKPLIEAVTAGFEKVASAHA